MDTTKSKVLFLVSLLIVRDTFVVLATFTQLSVEFNEEILIQLFREVLLLQLLPQKFLHFRAPSYIFFSF